MNNSFLKPLRVGISVVFILLTSVLFIDIFNLIEPEVYDTVLYLQFIPSFLEFASLTSLLSIGFIIILLLTIIFGRVYCSTICPLGILQDIVSFIKRKIGIKEKYLFRKADNQLRYSILLAAVLMAVAGSYFLVYLLDPFSIFGRIITAFVRPVFIGLNNTTVMVLESFDYYSLKPVEFSGWVLFPTFIALLFLALVVYLTIKNGRLYCNTVCPVGTFLGFLAKFSLFRLSVEQISCTKCGVCEIKCKSSCIDSEKQHIDFTRCVGCFNCLNVCPTEAIEWKFNSVYNTKLTQPVSFEKRNFLVSVSAYLLGASSLGFLQKNIEVYKKNEITVIRKNGISPPGSNSIEEFNEKCTACNLCVSVCSTQVLQPSFLEFGFLNMLHPRMNNKYGFCNYKCTECLDICPTGALNPMPVEDKKLTQIGKAKFIKDNCVVYTQKTDCGACAEHCPTKAVRMELDREVNLKAPEVTDDYCIGCGACEFACPTIPYKAIYVESNPVHKRAKEPEQEELDKEVDYQEDFPF